MTGINIRVSRDTHKKLEKLGRKGQSFDDIVQECITAKENENLFEYYYFPYRTSTNMNLQYGKISAPKNEKGDVTIELTDIIEAVRSAFDEENLIIKGYDK